MTGDMGKVEFSAKEFAQLLKMAEQNRGEEYAIEFFVREVKVNPRWFYRLFLEEHPK